MAGSNLLGRNQLCAGGFFFCFAGFVNGISSVYCLMCVVVDCLSSCKSLISEYWESPWAAARSPMTSVLS